METDIDRDRYVAAFNEKLRVKNFEQFSLLLFNCDRTSSQQNDRLCRILFDDHRSAKYWKEYVELVLEQHPDRKLQLQRLINKALEMIDEKANANNPDYVDIHMLSLRLKDEKDSLRYYHNIILKKEIGAMDANTFLRCADLEEKLHGKLLARNVIQRGITAGAIPKQLLTNRLKDLEGPEAYDDGEVAFKDTKKKRKSTAGGAGGGGKGKRAEVDLDETVVEDDDTVAMIEASADSLTRHDDAASKESEVDMACTKPTEKVSKPISKLDQEPSKSTRALRSKGKLGALGKCVRIAPAGSADIESDTENNLASGSSQNGAHIHKIEEGRSNPDAKQEVKTTSAIDKSTARSSFPPKATSSVRFEKSSCVNLVIPPFRKGAQEPASSENNCRSPLNEDDGEVVFKKEKTASVASSRPTRSSQPAARVAKHTSDGSLHAPCSNDLNDSVVEFNIKPKPTRESVGTRRSSRVSQAADADDGEEISLGESGGEATGQMMVTSDDETDVDITVQGLAAYIQLDEPEVIESGPRKSTAKGRRASKAAAADTSAVTDTKSKKCSPPSSESMSTRQTEIDKPKRPLTQLVIEDDSAASPKRRKTRSSTASASSDSRSSRGDEIVPTDPSVDISSTAVMNTSATEVLEPVAAEEPHAACNDPEKSKREVESPAPLPALVQTPSTKRAKADSIQIQSSLRKDKESERSAKKRVSFAGNAEVDMEFQVASSSAASGTEVKRAAAPSASMPVGAQETRPEHAGSKALAGFGTPVIPKEHMLQIGKNTYSRLGLLGTGGSSKVYQVLSTEMKLYAFKLVNVPHCEETDCVFDSYANEIQLLQKLRGSRYIIDLIDAEVDREKMTVKMIMESGEVDLAKVLQQKHKHHLQSGSLSAASAAGQAAPATQLDKSSMSRLPYEQNPFFTRMVWQEMLEAVDHIHQHRIVHGDLKPANFVFVKGHLKLIDFGIAKAISNDTTNIYRDNKVGTVNYMPPEALEPCEPSSDRLQEEETHSVMRLGRASDVWSLGCILYQMVYGSTPFSKLPTIQKLYAIPNPKFSIAYEPHPDVDAVQTIKMCLIRDPRQRAPIRGPQGLLSHKYLSLDTRRHDINGDVGDMGSANGRRSSQLSSDGSTSSSLATSQLDGTTHVVSENVSSSSASLKSLKSQSLRAPPEGMVLEAIDLVVDAIKSSTSDSIGDVALDRTALGKQVMQLFKTGKNVSANRRSSASSTGQMHVDATTGDSKTGSGSLAGSRRRRSRGEVQSAGKSPAGKRRDRDAHVPVGRPAQGDGGDMNAAANAALRRSARGQPYIQHNNKENACVGHSETSEEKRPGGMPLASLSAQLNSAKGKLKSIPSTLKSEIHSQKSALSSLSDASSSRRAKRWMRPKGHSPEKSDMKSVLERRIGAMRKFLEVEGDGDGSPTKTADVDTFDSNIFF